MEQPQPPQPRQQGKRSHQELMRPNTAVSVSSTASTPAALNFPETLYQVLASPDSRGIVAWLPDGQRFAIYDKARFVSRILPRYFDNAKYASFTRRLKRWKFERVPVYPVVASTYRHQHFRRDRPDLVRRMVYRAADGEGLMAEDGAPADASQGKWGEDAGKRKEKTPPEAELRMMYGTANGTADGRQPTVEDGRQLDIHQGTPSKNAEKSKENSLAKAELASRFGLACNKVACVTNKVHSRPQWQQPMLKPSIFSASSNKQQHPLDDVDPQVLPRMSRSFKKPSCFPSDNKLQQRLNDVDLQQDLHILSKSGHRARMARKLDDVRNEMPRQDALREHATASLVEELRRRNRRVMATQATLTQKILTLSRTHEEILATAARDARGGASAKPLPSTQHRRSVEAALAERIDQAALTQKIDRAALAQKIDLATLTQKMLAIRQAHKGIMTTASRGLNLIPSSTGQHRAAMMSPRAGHAVVHAPTRLGEETEKGTAARKQPLTGGRGYAVGLPPLKKRIRKPPAA